ncbi:MAG: hypothetical protein JRC90_10055 [Deltaproteobacteria bacterium]|nr:hypothetical protein [Deltaproteobacteria bacterium]
MAQHISIKEIESKGFQEIYKNISESFKKGISTIRSSLKFQEICDKNFKESENDLVFTNWRNVNSERERFEIHFDSQRNEITNIYFVK